MLNDKCIYKVTVPDDQRSLVDDTPNAYCVVVPDGASCCCIIYGWYTDKVSRGRWEANCSARWLVRHLIERIDRAVTVRKAVLDLTDTGSDAYREAFDQDGVGIIPSGWQVVEKIRKLIVGA